MTPTAPHARSRRRCPHRAWAFALICPFLWACGQGGAVSEPDLWADRVVSFSPGPSAGFGADQMPDVVLGPPRGGGETAGSLHVVSLGKGGEVVLAFEDLLALDEPGPDLIVFENATTTDKETGEVAVSEDGVVWHTWPCAAEDAAGGFAGCAGVTPVLAHPDNDLGPANPYQAGGDAFDLADLGVARARYVRIRDTGLNTYEGSSGGFDLDAVAVVHGLLECPEG